MECFGREADQEGDNIDDREGDRGGQIKPTAEEKKTLIQRYR